MDSEQAAGEPPNQGTLVVIISQGKHWKSPTATPTAYFEPCAMPRTAARERRIVVLEASARRMFLGSSKNHPILFPADEHRCAERLTENNK